MDINTFDQGMNLAFRINDLQKDVAAFLKDNNSTIAALPIFDAESALHKTVRNAVHIMFREVLKADPKIRERAEQDFSKDEIDKILSEGES